MKNSYIYIIITLTALMLSVCLYATNTNSERIALLRPLIDNDLEFNNGVTTDSIILWEKQLESEFIKQKQYKYLFHLKMMMVQSLITQGNTSLAINNANLMYQKAKELNYPLGIALSLRAIGSTYISSASIQAGINSYEEALKMMLKLPDADIYPKSTLHKLIFTKIKAKRMEEVPNDLKLLESLYKKNYKSPSSFFLYFCNTHYYIKTSNPDKALTYLEKLETLCKEYPYPYYISCTNLLRSFYHLETKEYDLALREFDELLQNTNKIGSYRYTQMLEERADMLMLMGKSQEACQTYDSINTYRDSLNAQNYSRQINELHTLYQIDQSEISNISKQKKILYWSISIILTISILIVYFIFRIRKENKCLRKSQQEQEKVKKQAESSIRTKSLFLSNMSHEIRTPLNALSGFSSILTDDSIDSETRKQCYEIIQQNSELLLKLINDVIDLSSLEIGKMEFNLKAHDAVNLSRNVVDMVKKIKQTSAEVSFTTSLDSLELLTDNARLQQVLINLLINATKFTPQGSITLELIKQSEDMALFSVTDTGCGIPREKAMTIFNRFEKLNENAQGTGLGLSICQAIIEHFGGKIWIDIDYCQGARFIFTHPIPQAKRKEETK